MSTASRKDFGEEGTERAVVTKTREESGTEN